MDIGIPRTNNNNRLSETEQGDAYFPRGRIKVMGILGEEKKYAKAAWVLTACNFRPESVKPLCWKRKQDLAFRYAMKKKYIYILDRQA